LVFTVHAVLYAGAACQT